MLDGAPKLLDFLGSESRCHFDRLRRLLDDAGITYTINPRLVRGLDYYTRTVFEWITDELGSQGTVCGGGRYDGLIALFSDKKLPASGFAIGIERLLLLIQATGGAAHVHHHPDIVVTCETAEQSIEALLLAHTLRQHLPQQKILSDFSGDKLKRQHSNALKSGCHYVITLNADQKIGLWDLQGNSQQTLAVEEICQMISQQAPSRHAP